MKNGITHLVVCSKAVKALLTRMWVLEQCSYTEFLVIASDFQCQDSMVKQRKVFSLFL